MVVRSRPADRKGLAGLLFEIHRDLPRQGPGHRALTERAWRVVHAATPVETILDVGCGPGTQTLDLASACHARIVAIDTHRPYLHELRRRVGTQHPSAHVHPLEASMLAMPVRPGSIDVIWCEGAAYVIGFERALREWKPLLRPGGCIAATHLSWLRNDPPAKARAFWAAHFPAMVGVETNLAVARGAGYGVLDHFTLPESAWWDDYYRPLERRLAELRARHQRDADALGAIAATQEEIDLYRECSASYGYVFYVLQRPVEC